MNFDTLGGRRFLLALLSYVGNWHLCWFGHIDGGVYSAVTIAVVATYVAGNVTQRKIETDKEKPNGS